ncbi:MAG TPA: hypothetical protein VNG13_09370 [Mycobacteriales bacterium]|nr:hypothetical protein [Mycobacteriales bacterium]
MPQRQPEFAHLSLPGLRRYRETLTAEEARVSYWRRIIQARLDLVRASMTGVPPAVDNLRGLFAGHRLTSERRVLIQVVAIDDMPPLPDLADLWARDHRPGDLTYNQTLVHDLSKAESQLSAYRTALHRRLDGATGELIARYRAEPGLCLSALPVAPNQRRTADG